MSNLLLSLLTVVFIFAGPCSASSITFTGVTTIDPGQSLVRENQTVIVVDGYIRGLGDHTQDEAPGGSKVIDASGQFLIPGLADMHVHLEHFDSPLVLALFVAHGVTLVRQMDGRPYILDWRDDVNAGQLNGPQIFSAGPAIDGDPPAEPDYEVAVDKKSGRSAVQKQFAAGYDLIKVYHGLSKPAFQGVVSTAQNLGLGVAGHVPWRVGIHEAVRSGLTCIEHLDGFDDLVAAQNKELPEPWHWRRRIFAYPLDNKRVQEAAQWVADNKLWIVPTLTVNDWRWLHPSARKQLEQRRATSWMPEAMVASWRPENWQGDRARQYKALEESDHQWIRRGFRNALEIVSALHQADTQLLLGTDTPNPYVVPGDSVHVELANLVQAGLTPMAALAAATSRPAAYLGREDLGCLRTGCQADLVLLQRDPVADITATRSITGVMVDGRWHSKGELQASIDEFIGANAAESEKKH